ncbi:MAG: HEAT repeat domain-containing protein [Phycisphaerae bacterium]|jgi:hypothetical protein
MRKFIVISFLTVAFIVSTSALASDISSLIKDLGNKEKAKDASNALAKIGKPAVPELIDAMKGNNNYQKRYATRAIREMGQTGSDAIPVLEKLLKEWDTQTREYAVEALGNMIEQSNEVLPILEKVVHKDVDENVRKKAKVAIEKIKTLLAERAALKNQQNGPVQEQSLNEKNPKPQEEIVQTAAECNNITVFGVPMKGTLQEIATALEKNGIEISQGYLQVDSNAFKKNLQSEINVLYDAWKIPLSRKEKALRLLEEGKLKGFCYEYKGEKYFVEPASFEIFFGHEPMPGIYPIIEDFPDTYNSQFLLKCDNFPAEMDYQGIRSISIHLKSIEQKEPTCFLIRLFFVGNPKEGLSKLLTDKYGAPTLRYTYDEQDEKSNEHVYGERFIKTPWPSLLTKHTNWGHPFKETEEFYPLKKDSLYVKVETVLAASRNGGKRWYIPLTSNERPIVEEYVLNSSKRQGEEYADFLMEWRCGNELIVLSGTAFIIKPMRDEYGTIVDRSNAGKVGWRFESLDYIDLSSIEELSSMYEKLYSASNEAKARVVEAGKSGF